MLDIHVISWKSLIFDRIVWLNNTPQWPPFQDSTVHITFDSQNANLKNALKMFIKHCNWTTRQMELAAYNFPFNYFFTQQKKNFLFSNQTFKTN